MLFWFMYPCYVCLGSPALTSRGMKEAEMHQVAEFMDQGIKLTIEAQKKTSKSCYRFIVSLATRLSEI